MSASPVEAGGSEFPLNLAVAKLTEAGLRFEDGEEGFTDEAAGEGEFAFVVQFAGKIANGETGIGEREAQRFGGIGREGDLAAGR